MSLYGALNIGVAGLAANAQALSATSSNIANVNTVGYKNQTVNFSTFLNTSGAAGSSSAGVTSIIGQDVTTQGLPTATSSPTDLSISGNGFFVVASNPSATATQEYTRAGSFTPDESGNLKNAAGLYLMGYKLDSSGNIPTDTSDLSLINVSALTGKAAATAKLGLQANLQSSSTTVPGYTAGQLTSGAVTPDFQRTVNVYDSQGGSQPVTMSFVKTGANTWAYEAAYAGSSANLSSANPIHSGTVSFNTDGSLANVDGAATPTGSFDLTIPWAAGTGLAAQTVSVSLGTVGSTSGLTQFDTASSLNGTTLDGSSFGNVTGVTISKDGTVTAQFSNGLAQDVYKVPVATFANPDGLAQINGNAYAATKASGAANINQANAGSAGGIAAHSLEASTVDLASEFTNLITTQRAYSASARIITTADQMLQQLEQLPSN
ncbi:MAG TPA: flagellar hook protein FlgE [Rhizomicrobium sp.]|jgi:flagellar hook protein FlgE|nr:flagellar hook protein FlgE [Rhizomicrobium sp.]